MKSDPPLNGRRLRTPSTEKRRTCGEHQQTNCWKAFSQSMRYYERSSTHFDVRSSFAKHTSTIRTGTFSLVFRVVSRKVANGPAAEAPHLLDVRTEHCEHRHAKPQDVDRSEVSGAYLRQERLPDQEDKRGRSHGFAPRRSQCRWRFTVTPRARGLQRDVSKAQTIFGSSTFIFRKLAHT